MEMNLIYILGAFVGGAVVGFITMQLRQKGAKQTADEIVRAAKRTGEREKNQFLIKAKEEWFKVRDKEEDKIRQKYNEVEKYENGVLENEKKLRRVEEQIKTREQEIGLKQKDIGAQKDALRAKDLELDKIIQQQNQELSKVTGYSLEDATEKLYENLRNQYKREAADIYKEHVDEAKANANREAQKIITYAIERQASEFGSETAVTVVNLPYIV